MATRGRSLVLVGAVLVVVAVAAGLLLPAPAPAPEVPSPAPAPAPLAPAGAHAPEPAADPVPPQGPVTFNRHVAPIGHRRCAPCHRPGQSGPFSLLSYEDYREHATDIADVVADGYMPPWKAVGPRGQFVGDRSLSPNEITMLTRWVEQGAVEGDPEDARAMPSFPQGFTLGEPDVVVRLERPYELGADGPDVYRNLVIRTPVKQRRWVAAWEFLPRSRTVHHAILYVDRTAAARARDAADPLPGYEDMDGAGLQSPDGYYLVWAPGKAALPVDDGTGWSLDGSADLVLQLHMQRTGKKELVDPLIGLHFASAPPPRRRYTLRVGDPPIDIPPGEKDYRIHDEIELAADLRLLSLFPHAHYLGKRMRVWAEPPGAPPLTLLRIDDWDFAWQDEYAYVEPPLLPAGTKVKMEFSYDNSIDNVRNPNRPPRRVVGGERSVDEMGNVTLQVLPERPQDLDLLKEARFRRQLTRGQGGRTHYNLANLLVRRGQHDAAITHFRKALADLPELESAHFNLGGILLQLGRHREAAEHFRKSIELRPDTADSHVHLARALQELGDTAGARAELDRALELAPGDGRIEALRDALK